MNPTITVIQNILLLSLILWVVYSSWQKLIVSIVRQKIFDVRNKLVLAGADNRIFYSSKQYELIENRLNLMIRFAHKITWYRMVITYFLTKRYQIVIKNENDIFYLFNQLKDKDLAFELTSDTNKVFMWMLLSIVLRSPILFCFLVIAILLYGVYKLINSLIKIKINFSAIGNKLINLLRKDVDFNPVCAS